MNTPDHDFTLIDEISLTITYSIQNSPDPDKTRFLRGLITILKNGLTAEKLHEEALRLVSIEPWRDRSLLECQLRQAQVEQLTIYLGLILKDSQTANNT